MGILRWSLRQIRHSAHQRTMKFAFFLSTLVFLCLQGVNSANIAGSGYERVEDIIPPISGGTPLTDPSGTAGVGVLVPGCPGCPKVCPPTIPCNRTKMGVQMCCLPIYKRGKPTCSPS